jgi:hypothetical protein
VKRRSTASRVQTPWTIFRVPLLLAAVSLFGLVAALLVDGPVDNLWAAAIAVPLLVVAAFWIRRRSI